MKKTLTMLLAAALCAASLAGCGGGGGGASSAGSAGGESGGSKASEASKAESVSISVVTTYAGEDTNAGNYQQAIQEWQDKTGNVVKDASATTTETQKAKILTDFETGTEPDVLFWFNGVDASPIIEKGKVVSIDEIRAVYPDYASNMKDGMMGASPVDGKNYSVPVNGIWEALFVNKTVLEQSGVEVPGPDYTWDQFLADCEKIKAAGFSPIAASLAEIPHYWFEYSIFNFGTPATHGVVPKTADDERGKAWASGISDIKDLYEKGYFPPNTLSAKDDETFNLFVQDQAAFLIDGNWKVGGIESRFKASEEDPLPDPEKIKNFTVTYVPGKNDRKATDIIAGLTSGYYISKKAFDDPQKQAAVVDFVSFMTSDDIVARFAGVSATALKNGTKVDESKLSSLGLDGLAMVKGATGTAPAVQDAVSQPCRVPLFDGMPKIVTGEVAPADAVQQCLDLIAKEASGGSAE